MTERRVLVVDDNADLADMLALIIQSYGHVTAVAYSGQEAIEAAAEFKPHVALLDLRMPGMTGYEVAAALRGILGLENLRLIAMSGWDDLHSNRLAQQIGFYRKLTKPLPMQEVKELIEAE